MKRDDAIEVVEVKERKRGGTSIQYFCPSCKKVLPKSSYSRVKRPQYCQECGQKLKYPLTDREVLVNLVLNDKQRELLNRVDSILEGKEI